MCRKKPAALHLSVSRGAPAQYGYLGAKPLETVDGDFASVGDLGYVDMDGYLFLADRRVDQIITGGANVLPAQVEANLTQHLGVRDAAVIGLKNDDLGRRVHALSYKLPRSYEILATLRDEAGKIRRSKLRDERGG